MAELAASAGLPKPEIDERGECVTVRFRRADKVLASQEAERELTEEQNAVLALLRNSGRALALREILRAMADQQMSERRLREVLSFLKVKNLVDLSDRGRGARWKAL